MHMLYFFVFIINNPPPPAVGRCLQSFYSRDGTTSRWASGVYKLPLWHSPGGRTEPQTSRDEVLSSAWHKQCDRLAGRPGKLSEWIFFGWTEIYGVGKNKIFLRNTKYYRCKPWRSWLIWTVCNFFFFCQFLVLARSRTAGLAQAPGQAHITHLRRHYCCHMNDAHCLRMGKHKVSTLILYCK